MQALMLRSCGESIAGDPHAMACGIRLESATVSSGDSWWVTLTTPKRRQAKRSSSSSSRATMSTNSSRHKLRVSIESAPDKGQARPLGGFSWWDTMQRGHCCLWRHNAPSPSTMRTPRARRVTLLLFCVCVCAAHGHDNGAESPISALRLGGVQQNAKVRRPPKATHTQAANLV